MLSPKQPTLVKKRDWYPYYAGFTERFVGAVISKHFADTISVVDPWSGSGTTTLVCARSGIPSTGLDVNPALTVIARARLTPHYCQQDIPQLANRIMKAARDLVVESNTKDPLCRWMRAEAVCRVRAIQEAIHLLMATDARLPDRGDVASLVDDWSELVCFFYSALFAAVRDLLGQFRTTNPMWLKNPLSERSKIDISWCTLTNSYIEHINYLKERLKLDIDANSLRYATLHTASANSLNFPDGHFGGALTSPPYATRVDYVMGTLPELAVLDLDADLLQQLRKQTTGSPVVSGVCTKFEYSEIASEYAQSLLDVIEKHPSKGSRRYYLPWMRNYIVGLQAGISEIVRTVHPAGVICIVVQDSYYKAVPISLQRIVIETLSQLGRSLDDRSDFAATTLRSRMNPRSRRHLATRRNTESLLVFG